MYPGAVGGDIGNAHDVGSLALDHQVFPGDVAHFTFHDDVGGDVPADDILAASQADFAAAGVDEEQTIPLDDGAFVTGDEKGEDFLWLERNLQGFPLGQSLVFSLLAGVGLEGRVLEKSRFFERRFGAVGLDDLDLLVDLAMQVQSLHDLLSRDQILHVFHQRDFLVALEGGRDGSQ